MATERVDALVIFGATGDLAKLETFPALVGLVDRGVLDVPVVGVAKSGWGLDQFREYAAASLAHNGLDPDDGPGQKMLGLLRYVDGDLDDDATYAAMSEEIGDGKRGAVLPGGAAVPVRPDRAGHLDRGPRRRCPGDGGEAVRQRPGQRPGAQRHHAASTSPRTAIYRVDHWLGLDPLEDVLVARFANSMFEPLLNRDHVGEHPDHHGRGVRRRRPRPLLRPDRRHPRRRAEPHAAGAGHRARRPARRLGLDSLAGRQGAGRSPRCGR